MATGRPRAIVAAVVVLTAAAVVLALAVVWGVLNDGLWVGGTDGLTYEAPPAILVGYGPLCPIAAFLARSVLLGRSNACLIGFVAWFGVMAVDILILGSPTTTPTFIGAVSLALTYAGRAWFLQDGAAN
jgi:hypothetical protein